MKSLEEEYLNIISKENEIIEEGKLVNSLLAGAALFSAASLCPPKISEKSVDVAEKVEMAKPQKKTMNINGFELDEIEQSEEEVYISKFIYAQVKDFANDNFIQLDAEINSIVKTLATRFIVYKEGDTPYEMIKKIGRIDASNCDFAITDRITYSIAENVRDFVENPEEIAWKDRSIVWYAKKNWSPTDNKFKYELKTHTKNYGYWSLQKVDQSKMDLNSLTDDEKFLARVIYSETSTICTPFEVKLVCKVIMNRIGRKDFANGGKTPQTASDVVRVKNAFSCINDKNNSNWTQFSPALNFATKRDCVYSHFMMQNDQDSIKLPSEYDSIVYYHDKSIQCPKAWTNKYWKPVLVIETEHFKFYKIVPNTKKSKNIT